MKKYIILLASVFMLNTASAHTLFYCKTTNQKQVLVEQSNSNNNQVNYSFGKSLANPEISLQKKFNEVEFDFRNHRAEGVMLYMVKILHKNYTYELAKLYRDNEVEGNIMVYKGDKHIATIDCIPNTVVYNDPIAVTNSDIKLPNSCKKVIEIKKEYDENPRESIENFIEELSFLGKSERIDYCKKWLNSAG